MSRKVLLISLLSAFLVGCGSDRSSIDPVAGSDGSASVSGEAVVGQTLTASVTDPDGVESGSETYQWYSDGAAISGATSVTYTLSQSEGGGMVSVVVRYTDSAGLRETVESAALSVQAAFALSATYVHALVDGASCEIAALAADGSLTDALGSGTTSNGVVSFGSLVPVDGAALITCAGGTYVDEASSIVLDAPLTRAVVDVIGDALFTVSPLTEIAAALAAQAGDLNQALTQFNESVGVNFALSESITDVTPTDIASAALANDEAGKYATALALISQLDATDTTKSAGEIIAAIASDLVDGVLSQETINAFNQAASDIALSPVGNNVNADALSQVSGAVNNVPEPATFEGLSASIANDQAAPLTGTVIVNDVNFGENTVAPQTDVATTYGTFSIAETGDWSYTLDTANTDVAGLEVGESVSDVIPITSADGTGAALVIRVAALTQVAEITNTINGDTGELRLDLDPHQYAGKLKFSFLKTEALADDGNQKDAYVTLYGASGSSSEALVDLRIQGSATNDDGSTRDPRFLVRNTDNASYPGETIEAPFTPNEWYEIEIIWDMAEEKQLSILINGEALGGGPFSTAAVVDGDFTDLNQWFSEGVQRVQWRFGDNGTVIPFGSYLIDNVEIYADTAGTALAFADDFEGYGVGDVLAGSLTYPNSIDTSVVIFDRSEESASTPAVFFNLVGAVNSDSAEAITGTITVIDPDAGEAALIEETNVSSTYGSISILASGDWEYTLDTADPAIAALVQGDRVTDTITVTSADGSTADLVITINGVGGEINAGTTQVAVIVDTDAGDTGELRYKLSGDPLAAGRVELKIKRLDDDLGNGDAFITLFNAATNNDGAILDFRIKDDSFSVRSPSSIDTSSLPHKLDEFMDVRITWEYPDGSTSVNPLVTISVDGVSLPSFTPENNSVGGVTHVSVRFGDNSGVREATGKVSVDDFAIYSDTTGFVEVFSDNFESYVEGDSLDTDNGASPYNSSTSEATVESTESLGGPGTPGNKFAGIVDTDSGDTGELRYKLSGDPIISGRIEAAVKRLDDELGNGDAFITLFNSATNNSGSILDFRIKDDSFAVRYPSSTDTSSLPHVLDEWMDVVVTWDYPGGDTTLAPQVVIVVDGVALDPITPDNSPFGGVTHVAFRFGDNSGVREATGILSIDNFGIYSDADGMQSVFSDDFEAYLEGDSLDTDNGASPYNSSTSEATVLKEPEADVGGPGTAGNKIANIIDTDAGDTGELRYKLSDADAPLAAGRVEVAVKRLDDDLGNGDAFITLFNSDTNNSGSILDFRIKDDSFGVRYPSSTDTSALSVLLDTWMNVAITWEYPGGDTAVAPEVIIEIDGVALPAITPDNSPFGGVTHVSFRFGDNSGVREATGIFSVDDLAIYSDTAGTAQVFSDDFESYLEGDSLDTDNAASPYNSSTSEATVGVEE
jgi:VCBS repeat-containing protein